MLQLLPSSISRSVSSNLHSLRGEMTHGLIFQLFGYVPSLTDILYFSVIWIVDSGATNHITTQAVHCTDTL